MVLYKSHEMQIKSHHFSHPIFDRELRNKSIKYQILHLYPIGKLYTLPAMLASSCTICGLSKANTFATRLNSFSHCPVTER